MEIKVGKNMINIQDENTLKECCNYVDGLIPETKSITWNERKTVTRERNLMEKSSAGTSCRLHSF